VEMLMAPLVGILEAGRRDGSFPAAEPATDAPLISAMVWDAVGLMRPPGAGRRREDVRHETLSFCLRALGAS
jgi:hypothetical protein